jgi:ketosteroid isomerase-like protein
MVRKIALAACLVLCVAPAMAQSVADIQKLDDAWAVAFNKGDAKAAAAMYAVDAYVLPDKGEMVHGRAAIETFFKGATQQIGDIALKIGTFTFKTKSQPPQDVSGKYAVVWRKIGGQWLLATDIWNSNK